MTGALVTDPLLCQAPNDNNICGDGTDLEGVYVTDPTTQCNIFATCLANSPLGIALNLAPGSSVEVADPQLCNLDVPGVTVCGTGTNNVGAVVTDPVLCEAPNNGDRCVIGTDLEGVYVNDRSTDCNIFPRCPIGSNLGAGAQVTDIRLCNAATPAIQCAAGTDLAGIWVHPAATASCNISPADISLTTNPQSQCLKCADLAIFGAPSGQQDDVALELRGGGTGDNNVFTVCSTNPDPRPAFNDLVSQSGSETFFSDCLTDAAANAGTQSLQTQSLSLQENSFTTDIEAQNEIPSTTDIQAQNEIDANTDIQAQELQQQVMQQLHAPNEIPATIDKEEQTEIPGFSLPLPAIPNLIS
jgi:hypothetical protein